MHCSCELLTTLRPIVVGSPRKRDESLKSQYVNHEIQAISGSFKVTFLEPFGPFPSFDSHDVEIPQIVHESTLSDVIRATDIVALEHTGNPLELLVFTCANGI